jgi:hypothetical protein
LAAHHEHVYVPPPNADQLESSAHSDSWRRGAATTAVPVSAGSFAVAMSPGSAAAPLVLSRWSADGGVRWARWTTVAVPERPVARLPESASFHPSPYKTCELRSRVLAGGEFSWVGGGVEDATLVAVAPGQRITANKRNPRRPPGEGAARRYEVLRFLKSDMVA